MITQKFLKECLHYDSDTGVFTWLKERPLNHFKNEHGRKIWRSKFGGTVAGTDHPDCRTIYREIGISGTIHQAHRLAWLYLYGEFPRDQIDHKDGDGLNNRISNLRDVTGLENLKNQRMRLTNTSGCTGVSLHKQSRRWHAYIGRRSLGYFVDIEDAVAARKAAEAEHGYHVNHGRSNHLV